MVRAIIKLPNGAIIDDKVCDSYEELSEYTYKQDKFIAVRVRNKIYMCDMSNVTIISDIEGGDAHDQTDLIETPNP